VLASLRPMPEPPQGARARRRTKRLEQELPCRSQGKGRACDLLVDLGRKIWGRVCGPGKRRGHDLMVIERYFPVMHIVSQVDGFCWQQTRTFWDLLQLLIPGQERSGGARKNQSHAADPQLETDARGPYSRRLRRRPIWRRLSNTPFTIRTLVVLPDQPGAAVSGGSGRLVLVADRQPAAEYGRNPSTSPACSRRWPALRIGTP